MKADPNLNVVLYQPKIPQNTGNIGRLCVGTYSKLHLVKPYGFELSEKKVRRAGLDYWPNLMLEEHEYWEPQNQRTFLFSKFAKKSIFDVEFHKGDTLVFGAETTGLPAEMREAHQDKMLTFPMYGPIRSHNLSNTVSAAVYIALMSLHKRGDEMSGEVQEY